MKIRDIKLETGRCALCGRKVANGNICFDCYDPSTPNRELRDKLKSLPDISKLIKPEEGIDYITLEEVIVYVNASGVTRVMSDGDNVEESIDYSKIEWDDIDVGHTESTGKTMMVDMKGAPFNLKQWQESKLSKLGLSDGTGKTGCNQQRLF